MMQRNNQGFTLLELLIAIAVISILMTLGIGQLRPPNVRLFANTLKAQVQQARLEAIKRNRPVAVLWSSSDKSFTTLVKASESSTELPCSASDQVLTKKLVTEYRSVEVGNVFTSSVTATAIVWYPNGLPKFCSGGAITTNSSTKISDSHNILYVRVDPAGKVDVSNAAQ